MNLLHRFREVYRDLDRSLDARDRREFVLASRRHQDLVARLRDLIDTISVADIVASDPWQAAGLTPRQFP